MKSHNYCIIMAGGVGVRFWPLSTTDQPKQFIDILGTGQTLIQMTWNRFRKIIPAENIYIVTNFQYRELVLQQIPEISEEQVLCEPARRNTAPCIAYASYKICQQDPEANFVVAPSDHIILQEENFLSVIRKALEVSARSPYLFTLGIRPNRPDTGYGYIQFNENHVFEGIPEIRKVKTFTEKPVLEMAETFLRSGDFLWNSGIFIWSAQSILEAFDRHLPEISSLFREGNNSYNTPDEPEFIREAYGVCTNISIDYGVMEKADNVLVYMADFGWSDLGTWGSLYEQLPRNEHQNAIVSSNVIMYDCANCIVNLPEGKLAVIQKLDGYIVVESNDMLLICRKEDEQDIRLFVNDVKSLKGDQYI
ncbi:MAG TPA: mannose-1-phosphate guanylyltransferase [Bacteroidales bacterium]|nr:mannose-1-phosphate guanylyltransferase [Bacteroidales bacterium]HRZ47902.1 mannose-1-phosphate guanylyltransferase [Bacteroidales bacterium]